MKKQEDMFEHLFYKLLTQLVIEGIQIIDKSYEELELRHQFWIGKIVQLILNLIYGCKFNICPFSPKYLLKFQYNLFSPKFASNRQRGSVPCRTDDNE